MSLGSNSSRTYLWRSRNISSQPALECLIYTVRQQQILHPFGKASADCMFATARILV